MKLEPGEALERLTAHDHGTFCTVHPERGVDAVPVVYAVDGFTGGATSEAAGDDYLGIPIDRVKPKKSLRLQRERNLETDPRATLLIEHWDRDDWSQLWWARAQLRWIPDPAHELTMRLSTQLADRFVQYRSRPFASILVLRIVAVTGWAA